MQFIIKPFWEIEWQIESAIESNVASELKD